MSKKQRRPKTPALFLKAMDEQVKRPEDALTPDGYLCDQDCFSSVRYRTMSADINGCGFLAAYNLRHYLGHAVGWDEVRRELDAMHCLRVPGPTLMVVMRAYLARYAPEAVETVGREAALTAARQSRAGVFRYREGRVPHFVSYVREGALFRFFNVDDGLEDVRMSMEDFVDGHCAKGVVIVFAIPD